VNCELARRLMDDFMLGDLNQGDRSRMEAHLAACPGCTVELRKYPALEREVRRALAASVRPLYLSADASARIVQASEESLSQSGRAHRTMLTVRIVSGAVAVLLVAVGLLALLGRIPVPSSLKSVSLLSAQRVLPSEPELDITFDAGEPIPRMATPALSPVDVTLLIEPPELHPRETFTMTVYVQSGVAEPMEPTQLDLDISGPTGFYRFELSFDGPLPAEGMSIFRVTPDLLAKPCEERYLMPPTDIFSVPGAYTIRATLLNPVVVSQ
jgi:hypothetical protein